VVALLAAGALAPASADAQVVGAYTRTTFTAPYAPISTGGGAATVVAGDNFVADVALPFDFTFAGRLYPAGTLATVCTNGWMCLAPLTGLVDPYSNNVDGYFNQPDLLAPWFDDLNSTVLTQTQGVVGSRTFTVQWSGASWPDLSGGTPSVLDFQAVLHEGTNVAEFQYGPVAVGYSIFESASSLICGDAGGSDAIDAWTGSHRVGNGVLAATCWPSRHVRFAPGMPTAIPAGSYTAGAGGAYPSVSEALADLCHRGISGPVEIVVTDAVNNGTTNIFPLLMGPVAGQSAINTLIVRGLPGATIVMPPGNAAPVGTQPPIAGFVRFDGFFLVNPRAHIFRAFGLKHTTVRDLALTVSPGAAATVGFELNSFVGSEGSQFNVLRDVTVDIGGGGVTGTGVQQITRGTPPDMSGTNSHNRYLNLQVPRGAAPFRAFGAAALPDEDIWLGTDGGSTVMGGPTPGSLGGTAVSITNARDVRVFDCEVRNIATGAAGGATGILVNNAALPSGVSAGVIEVSGNRVHDIAGTATGVGNILGISVSLGSSSASNARVFNNVVWGLESASTGGGIMRLAGIRLTGLGVHDVDFNSVRIEPTGLGCSSSALDMLSGSGPVMHIRNNVLANFAGAQVAPAAHYAISTNLGGFLGGAGSISDRNVLYVANPTQGFIGLAGGAYATLAAWQGLGFDLNSASADPLFVSPTDLHLSSPASPANALGSYFAGAITWAGTDIDGDARHASTPDAGADEAAFVVSDAVAAQPAPGLCISTATPCVSVPVVWSRNDVTPARGYSVTVELSPNLTLCGAQATSAGYLAPGAAPPPVFAMNALPGNRWVIDEVTLGLPCGATGSGTLFNLLVGSSGPLTGTGTIRVVSVLARDCPNNPIPANPGLDATVTIDLVGPVAVADLAAGQQLAGNDADGTTKIAVSFSAPPDAAGVQVWRRGFGGYPQYDENGGTTPTTPASPAAALADGWTLTAITASGQLDEPATRDVWHYVVFSADGCGNVSAVSNQTGGTLNYHLGDFHNTLADCAGDNQVTTADLSFLGAHYGATLAINDPLECLDVGPTLDLTAGARPTTDNVVNFEDLITLALNYGQVSAPQLAARPARDEDRGAQATASRVWLETPAVVREGDTFEARIRVDADGDLYGLATQLGWDPGVVELLATTSGDLFEARGGVALSPRAGALDGALLGRRDDGLAGDGVFAIARFRALAGGAPGVTLERVAGRDARNRVLAFGGGTPPDAPPPALPALTELALPRPNPFHGEATLEYALASDGPVKLAIYALDGRLVRTVEEGPRPAGAYRAIWNGRDASGHPVAAGLYFARLSTAQGRFTRTLAVLR
jgi:hypothetical protein